MQQQQQIIFLRAEKKFKPPTPEMFPVSLQNHRLHVIEIGDTKETLWRNSDLLLDLLKDIDDDIEMGQKIFICGAISTGAAFLLGRYIDNISPIISSKIIWLQLERDKNKDIKNKKYAIWHDLY